MTPPARLTWQVPDPAAVAADLARRLGVEPPVPLGPPLGAFAIELGVADLEVVPWRRETPDDAPQPAGRLVLEPVFEADLRVPASGGWASGPESGGAAPRQGALPRQGAAPRLRLVGIAWGTVDLERAAAELAAWLLPDDHLPDGLPRDGADPHLGARTRLAATSLWPDTLLVLAEPVTEGLVAASLARHDEGPCALYLRPGSGLDAWQHAARQRSVTVSARRSGPLGTSVVLSGGRARAGGIAGPHVLLIDGTGVASGHAASGTIRP